MKFMKKFLLCAGVLAALAVAAATSARAQGGSDDDYLRIYGVIAEGDTLDQTGDTPEALAKYTQAQSQLQKFAEANPDWNAPVVKFRLSYLKSKIAELSARPPAASAPPGTNSAAAQASSPASGPSSADENVRLTRQVASLQEQLRILEDDNQVLQAKLKEALSVRPESSDPGALAKAQDAIATLQKENSLLQVSLGQEKARPAADSNTVARFEHDLSEARQQAAALQAEKQSLENDKQKLQLENTVLQDRVKQLSAQPAPAPAPPPAAPRGEDDARMRALEEEHARLAKELETAKAELAAERARTGSKALRKAKSDLEVARAKLQVYEAQKTPLTTEELALLSPPDAKLADHAPATAASADKPPLKELSPAAAALASEAQQLFSSRQYEQAEAKYLEVLKTDENNYATLANVAEIELQMNHFGDAEAHLRKAVELAPGDSFSLLVLGQLKERQGRFDEAIDALSRAAPLDPKNAEIQNLLGLALSQNGQPAPAEAAFRKAIELDPNYPEAHFNLAVFYAASKPPMPALARWHYQRALSLGHAPNPDFEKALDAAK